VVVETLGLLAHRDVAPTRSLKGMREARAVSRMMKASLMDCFTVHDCVAVAFTVALRVRRATRISVA